MNTNQPDRILKLGLLCNAGFSLIAGLILITSSRPIAGWIGVADPLALAVVGFLLVPFAAHLWIAAKRRVVHHSRSVTSVRWTGLGLSAAPF